MAAGRRAGVLAAALLALQALVPSVVSTAGCIVAVLSCLALGCARCLYVAFLSRCCYRSALNEV